MTDDVPILFAVLVFGAATALTMFVLIMLTFAGVIAS